ncbi:MAG TPA: DegT/DnrJ/EryC1/StrS family aminotransferase [Streptosporangiaceae bacterium]
MISKLAMFGGQRTVDKKLAASACVRWPVVTDVERDSVRRVMENGGFTSVGAGGREVELLEAEWAALTGVPYCAAVATGTAAIELALAALGIEPGAEILVPALTFIGSAVAPVQRLIVPVFVDIDPETFTIDPAAVEAGITPRTQAILAVHLHGLPCSMDRLRSIATRHGLSLIEDAAQAHGAKWGARRVGAVGDAAAFSLNSSKNLPTCGEGGLVTTSDPGVHERVVLQRQFGEDLGGERDYLSQILGGNAKLSAINAAFARCQLRRLAEYDAIRERNVLEFFARLADLSGILLPRCPADRTHAWHILRLRFAPPMMGYPDIQAGALRMVIQRALKAEGVPMKQYQLMPLPAQPAFRTRDGFGGYPWRLSGTPRREYHAGDYPATVAVIEDSLTLQRWHLNPASGPVLSRCADAFEKVWQHLDTLAQCARAMDSPAKPADVSNSTRECA